MHPLRNPHARLFAGAFAISFSPVFVNLTTLSPTTIGFYRVLIGGSALALVVFLSDRRIRLKAAAWRALAIAALCFASDLWFWHRSIFYVGPGLATLLGNLQVFFMMGAGALLLHQRPTARQSVAVPLAIFGLAMIVGLDWNALAPDYRLGVIFGVLTAVCYAGYLLNLRRAQLASEHAVPTREVAVVSLMTAALLGASALVEGDSLAIAHAADLGWLLAYGLLCHAIGWILIASSLARVTTTEAGIALLLQPTLSFVWDIVFFGRPLALGEALGAALTLVAIFLGSLGRSKEPARPLPRADVEAA